MIALFFLAMAVVSSAALTFTGNATADFLGGDTTGTVVVNDESPWESKLVGLVNMSRTVKTDVGVPSQLGDSMGVLPISGWDVKRIFFQFVPETDELHIGVDCFGICGDADGDGNPGAASAKLINLGGEDVPLLAQLEGIAMAIDLDLDVAEVLPTTNPDTTVPFDFMLGVPAGQPAGATANPAPGEVGMLECTVGVTGPTVLNQPSCFGLYEYQVTSQVNMANRFLRRAQLNGTAWPVIDQNPNPSAQKPDLEWTIQQVTAWRASKGLTFQQSNSEPWTMLIQLFFGSFIDAGIGEDFVPAQTKYVEVVLNAPPPPTPAPTPVPPTSVPTTSPTAAPTPGATEEPAPATSSSAQLATPATSGILLPSATEVATLGPATSGALLPSATEVATLASATATTASNSSTPQCDDLKKAVEERKDNLPTDVVEFFIDLLLPSCCDYLASLLDTTPGGKPITSLASRFRPCMSPEEEAELTDDIHQCPVCIPVRTQYLESDALSLTAKPLTVMALVGLLVFA